MLHGKWFPNISNSILNSILWIWIWIFTRTIWITIIFSVIPNKSNPITECSLCCARIIRIQHHQHRHRFHHHCRHYHHYESILSSANYFIGHRTLCVCVYVCVHSHSVCINVACVWTRAGKSCTSIRVGGGGSGRGSDDDDDGVVHLFCVAKCNPSTTLNSKFIKCVECGGIRMGKGY